MSKIEQLLFGLILLCIPVNLAKHFFFDFVYVDGILVDYLIPTVYLTDILIWGLLGIWLFRAINHQQSTIGNPINNLTIQQFNNLPLILSLTLLAVSALSISQAANQPAAVYKWLKLVEYILFALYISKHVDLKKDFFTVVKLLSIGVLFESVLAIAQWCKQGSVFGYWFFGENKYAISTPGIATFDLFGVKKVRPYGTTPHPNVLGGYLAVLLPLVFYDIRSKSQIHNSKLKILSVLLFILGIFALCLSFSRSAWIVGALGVLATFFLTSSHPHLFTASLITPLSSLLATLSYVRRAELNWIALEMVKDQPLLGVGLNNFAVAMDKYGKISGWTRFLQPVHNVYLLLAAETGLLGLAAFLYLLFTIYYLLLRNKNLGALKSLLLVSLTQVVLLCFVDHYFFTLQQSSLLFWSLVGLVFATRDSI